MSGMGGGKKEVYQPVSKRPTMISLSTLKFPPLNVFGIPKKSHDLVV